MAVVLVLSSGNFTKVSAQPREDQILIFQEERNKNKKSMHMTDHIELGKLPAEVTEAIIYIAKEIKDILPELKKSKDWSKYDYSILLRKANELFALKFPQMFKEDIDVTAISNAGLNIIKLVDEARRSNPAIDLETLQEITIKTYAKAKRLSANLSNPSYLINRYKKLFEDIGSRNDIKFVIKQDKILIALDSSWSKRKHKRNILVKELRDYIINNRAFMKVEMDIRWLLEDKFNLGIKTNLSEPTIVDVTEILVMLHRSMVYGEDYRDLLIDVSPEIKTLKNQFPELEFLDSARHLSLGDRDLHIKEWLYFVQKNVPKYYKLIEKVEIAPTSAYPLLGHALVPGIIVNPLLFMVDNAWDHTNFLEKYPEFIKTSIQRTIKQLTHELAHKVERSLSQEEREEWRVLEKAALGYNFQALSELFAEDFPHFLMTGDVVDVFSVTGKDVSRTKDVRRIFMQKIIRRGQNVDKMEEKKSSSRITPTGGIDLDSDNLNIELQGSSSAVLAPQINPSFIPHDFQGFSIQIIGLEKMTDLSKIIHSQ